MKYFTNAELEHGLGSIFCKIIVLMGYQYFLDGYEFLYNPLKNRPVNLPNQLSLYYHDKNIDHNKKYYEIRKNWDSLIDYKGKTINDISNEHVTHLIHANLFNEKEFDVFNYVYNVAKSDVRKNFKLLNETREYIKISIHIRRGDVNPKHHPDRWLSDEYYLKILDDLKISLDGYDFKIKIHTQKNGFNKDLFNGDYEIVYDTDTEDHLTWLDLNDSDILVLGKSSFSYGAALISNGIIIYPQESMFHPKLDNWVLSDNIKQIRNLL